jgi:hypothetical protein
VDAEHRPGRHLDRQITRDVGEIGGDAPLVGAAEFVTGRHADIAARRHHVNDIRSEDLAQRRRLDNLIRRVRGISFETHVPGAGIDDPGNNGGVHPYAQ